MTQWGTREFTGGTRGFTLPLPSKGLIKQQDNGPKQYFLFKKSYFFLQRKVLFFVKKSYFFLQTKVLFFTKKSYFFLQKKVLFFAKKKYSSHPPIQGEDGRRERMEWCPACRGLIQTPVLMSSRHELFQFLILSFFLSLFVCTGMSWRIAWQLKPAE